SLSSTRLLPRPTVFPYTTLFRSFEFRTTEKVMGYVLAAINEDMVHYWFAFFDTEYMRTHSLGKWMMWKVIRWAKENGRRYAYLRSEEHTSELQSRENLVCRLLLE